MKIKNNSIYYRVAKRTNICGINFLENTLKLYFYFLQELIFESKLNF